MRCVLRFLPIAMVLAFSGEALAQLAPAPPTKRVRIYNNSGSVLNVFIQTPIISKKEAASDLWMQAQFKVSDWDAGLRTTRNFNTTRLNRAYIQVDNTNKGISPNGGWVEITVPFYTQLKETTDDDLGKVEDQFINWWNAARIYIFDSATAYHAARVTNNDQTSIPGGGLPQPVVKYLSGAAVPTCVSSDGATCTVTLAAAAINPPDGIPFQLQEYTFGSAEGPPLNKTLPPPTRTKMIVEQVNYNVSSLDSVFLPVAMGPLTKDGKTPVPYVGTALTVGQFRTVLHKWLEQSAWPYYVPIYYDDKTHDGFPSSVSRACSLDAAKIGLAPYDAQNLPNKTPGAFNVLEESYKGMIQPDLPPVPPILSSNPADWKARYQNQACSPAMAPAFVNPPGLGKSAQGMIDLWAKCTGSEADNSATCLGIRNVKALLDESFAANCPRAGAPPAVDVMRAVYGWVPIEFNGCKGADLVKSGRFAAAQKDYCNLQYNYLTVSSPADIFNPYTALVHRPDGLASSAYAFSIDDKLSFKSLEAAGVIIAIGGANGLENTTATPLPTSTTILDHCKAP